MKKIIDLSHTITDGLVTYKGLPPPIICDYISREQSKTMYAEGTSFQIGSIQMCSNTGTYLDAPFHRYEDGKDISQLEIEALASLEGIKIVVDEGVSAIDESYFYEHELQGKAVLVETKWSKHWNTEAYYEGHPHLTEKAAEYLRDAGVVLVGIDSYNIDDVVRNERPVHSTLLDNDILIVEHLCNLTSLPNSGFAFYAVPVKVAGFGTFPVRAFAEVWV